MQEQGSTVTARLTVWEKEEEKPHYYTPGQLLGEDSSSKKEQHEMAASSLWLPSILLYGCETRTLIADSEKSIQAFETKCMKKLLCIFGLEHKINNWARSKINFLVGPHKPLLATVKRRKLAWIGHVTSHNSLSKTILLGTLEVGSAVVSTGNAGWTTLGCGQHRGQSRKRCKDIIEWTSLPIPELIRRASCRKDWKMISTKSSLKSP